MFHVKHPFFIYPNVSRETFGPEKAYNG